MTGVCLTDSISGNFIMQMIPHHTAAIEMSANILKYTTDPQLIRMLPISSALRRKASKICGKYRNAEAPYKIRRVI